MESSKWKNLLTWIGRAISFVTVLPFVMGAVMKLSSNPQVIEGMPKMGIPLSLMIPIGILEALCVVLYLTPFTSVLGAILLTGFIGGTILTHLRIGESVPLQVTLGVLTWLGLYLRDPRLRELIPIRKKAHESRSQL